MDIIFQTENPDAFRRVSQEIITSLYCSGKPPSSQSESTALENAKQELKTMLSDCNFDFQKLNVSFNNNKWNQANVQYFLDLLQKNWSEVLSAALVSYSSNYGETVVNFNWTLKYVLGTSELKTLKYPLLQLVLSTVNKASQKNNSLFEIDKNMLLKLINVLENI